jgi:hypothetical protein
LEELKKAANKENEQLLYPARRHEVESLAFYKGVASHLEAFEAKRKSDVEASTAAVVMDEFYSGEERSPVPVYEADWRAALFPSMSAAAFATFTADIEAYGQREPIWLLNGKVLDGWHRYLACTELGIAVQTREFTGDDVAALAFVLSANLSRRHLDASQRAMIAARIATLQDGQHAAPIGAPSQRAAAEMLNVGRRSVQRAREVIDEGGPALAEAVDRGEVTVSAAAQSLRPQPYVKPADKYIAEQEARLGPVGVGESEGAVLGRSNEERCDDLKGAIASLRAIRKRLAGYKFRDIDLALAGAEMAIEWHLPQAT